MDNYHSWFRKLSKYIIIWVLLYYNTTTTAASLSATITSRNLTDDNSSYSGNNNTSAKIGGYGRQTVPVYDWEVIFQPDLSSIPSTSTIDSVIIGVTIDTDSDVGNTPMLIYIQNKGAFSTTANYDTYSLSAWDTLVTLKTFLGTGSTTFPISDTLNAWVQDVISGSRTNNGLILTNTTGYWDYYLMVSGLTVTVYYTNNQVPTDIALSPSSLYEGQASGTFVGVLTSTDQDAGDVHTYTFATGGTDNASFSISNDTLYSNAVYDYDVKNSYSIKIRTTDNGTGSLWYEKTFTVTILEVEDIDDWGNSLNIYINTTATGANVSNNVYDFPLLVRLDPSNFSDFANTNANGEDIRFTKSNGSFLHFEKEFWKDGASDVDTAAFWVKVDTVLGNNSEQFIKMWWNKASETSVTNSENVFEISNDFAAVYHLDEEQAGTGTADVYVDATSNSNDADDYSSATGQDAVAKEGQQFDGTDDYLSIPQSASLDITGDVTMSGWFKLDGNFTSASSASEIILTKHKNNDNNMVITLVGTDYDQPLVSDGSLAFKVECRDKYTGSYKFVWTNTTSWTAGTWYYFTVVIDYDNMANNKIYIDGVDDTN